MEREINIKCLLLEGKRNIKYIIAIGLTIAVFFSLYSYINTYNKAQEDNKVYGVSCEIYVEPSKNLSIFNMKNGETSISSFTVPILKSESLLEAISHDPKIQNEKLSKETISAMLYPVSLNNGVIIKLSVVGSTTDLAELVCKTTIEKAVEEYQNKGFVLTYSQEPQKLGAVAIIQKENPEKEGQLIYDIIKANDTVVSPFSIIKKGVLGFIAGVLLSWLAFVVVFIMRDIIIYPSQIKDNTGVRVFEERNKLYGFEKIYSELLSNNVLNGQVGFVCLNKTYNNKCLVNQFAEFLVKLGNKVLVINLTNDNSNEYVINDEISEYQSISIKINSLYESKQECDPFKDYINEYDYILINCDNYLQIPILKVVAKKTDGLIVTMNRNTIKLGQFIENKIEMESEGINIIGSIILEC